MVYDNSPLNHPVWEPKHENRCPEHRTGACGHLAWSSAHGPPWRWSPIQPGRVGKATGYCFWGAQDSGNAKKKINVAPSVHILSWFSIIMFTWSHGYVFFLRAFLPDFLWKLNQIYHYSPTWNPKFQLPQPPGVLPRRRRHPPTAPCRRHSSSPAPSRMDDVYKWRVATWEELFEKRTWKLKTLKLAKWWVNMLDSCGFLISKERIAATFTYLAVTIPRFFTPIIYRPF